MTHPILLAWLRAFVFTQVVEMPIYRRLIPSTWRDAFIASAITHPLVWIFFLNEPWPLGERTRLIICELFAWLVEATWFRRVTSWRRALAVSLLANGASVAAGMISRHFFHLP